MGSGWVECGISSKKPLILLDFYHQFRNDFYILGLVYDIGVTRINVHARV